MKRIYSTLAALLMVVTASAQLERPKLVVGIMVDQMRWDYLSQERLYGQCAGADGTSRCRVHALETQRCNKTKI